MEVALLVLPLVLTALGIAFSWYFYNLGLERGFQAGAIDALEKVVAGKKERADDNGDNSSRNDYPVELVGESHYQDVLNGVVRLLKESLGEVEGPRSPVTVELHPEPNNPADPNAIIAKIQGQTVGYLKKVEARRLADRVGEGVQTAGIIRGGGRTANGFPKPRGVFLAPPETWKPLA